jgi:hypothetical protein
VTPDDLYKTILRTLTSVRRVHAEQTTRHTLDGTPHATDAVLDDMARNAAEALIGLLDNQPSVKGTAAAETAPVQAPRPLHVLRTAAETTARRIVKADVSELSDVLAEVQALQLLAGAYIELRDQIRALHDLVDQTDPNDPIGTALTKVGLARRPPDWTERGPRLVPTPLSPAQISTTSPDQLLALYCRVMCEIADVFVKYESYVVRHWDGMDGCWTDCTGAVDREKALRAWAERTDGGTRCVAYAGIDYYRIFPSGTHMLWDGTEGQERHR